MTYICPCDLRFLDLRMPPLQAHVVGCQSVHSTGTLLVTENTAKIKLWKTKRQSPASKAFKWRTGADICCKYWPSKVETSQNQYYLLGTSSNITNPSLWLAVVLVILYDRPTPPPVGGEGLSKPSPEALLHVTASGITLLHD